MRHAALFLIVTQVIRVMWNLLVLLLPEQLKQLKSGQSYETFPDESYAWYRSSITKGHHHPHVLVHGGLHPHVPAE